MKIILDDNKKYSDYKCIVIGVSAGGTKALEHILPRLHAEFNFPVIVVQHLHPNQEGFFIKYFNKMSKLTVKEADEKERLKKSHIYIAPPNYHLLLEDDCTFSLSIDAKVNFARPSIDVLFECASDVFRENLIGIVLTGANDDGARGLLEIKRKGGLAVVQDPADAEVPSMPKAAIKIVNIDYIFDLENLVYFLNTISKKAIKEIAASSLKSGE